MVHVAVIDDGVNEKCYNTGKLEYNIEITPDLEICERNGYNPFESSHGTTCAAIIKKYYHKAVLSSVKIISDKSGKGMKCQLVKGIQWCLDNRIQIASLSLGSVDYRDFDQIKQIAGTAYEKGLVIVAACNNRGIFTCPASLEDVIGVKSSKSLNLDEHQYVYHNNPLDGIDITACSEHKLLTVTGEETLTPLCNSFATPMITARACEIIEKYPGISLAALKEELRKGAVNYLESYAEISKNIYEDIPQKEVDVPLIILYSNKYESMMDVLETFQRNFRKDGYYAVDVYGQTKAGLQALHSISIHKKERVENLKSELERFYKVYDCDVLLLGLEIIKENINLIPYVEKVLKPDISIFILDGYGHEINSAAGLRDKNETFIITLSKKTYLFSSAGIAIYDHAELEILYKQILSVLQ